MKTKTIKTSTNNLFIIVFLLFSSLIFGQTTYVPDNNFENYLETHDASGNVVALGSATSMGNGIANDDFVTTANISNVTNLDVGTLNIYDLTGIAGFTALKTLVCNNNHLTNLNLLANTALTYIHCPANNLINLDVPAGAVLTNLFCFLNNLTSLDVSANTALIELNCSRNILTSLDVSTNTALTNLNCYNNYLTTLDVSTNTVLDFLICDTNSLTSLNIKNGHNNIITHVNADSNPNLMCINVDNAIAANAGTGVYSTWSKDATATYGENCNTYIPDNNFEQTLIDLGYDDFLDDYVLTSNIDGLTSLDVSNKNIANLTGIQSFTSLQTLNISQNNLNSVDLSSNINLTLLNCKNNTISVLNLMANTSLNTLKCQTNSITTLNVTTNTALVTLWCYGNQIQSLNLDNNINLTDIRCQSNNLNRLTIKNVYNSNITTFSAHTNPNLTCIEVNDVFALNAFLSNIDPQTSFNTNCHYYETYIPDTIFEAYLETHDENGNIVSSALSMGNGISGDHYVTTANINTVTNLDISGLTINDLTGIEDFVALTFLNCSDNLLISIDISNNTALTDLRCFSNSLTNLDVSNNTALKKLWCYFNSLTNLDVSNNTALTDLRCFSNSLTSLDVSNNIALTFLFCSSNSFTNLDVSNNTALTYLNCNNNQLTSLNVKNGNNANFSSFSAINAPNLNCIQIDTGFTPNSNWFKDATASYSTNCHFNETYVPDNNFETYLETHDANGNVVAVGSATSMGNGIANDDYVTTAKISGVLSLYLFNENISDLTGIEDFVSLTFLECSSNLLTSLNIANNTALTELICGNNSLTSLDVSNNTLLTSLKCYHNLMTSLNVSNNSALLYLDCSTNSLTNLNVSNSTVLQHLECKTNSITNLDVSNNTALTFLSCSINSLTNLNVSNNTALDILSCSMNSLTNLNVSNNTLLTFLECNTNSLTSLDVTNNSALIALYSYNNSLTSLDVSNSTALTNLLCYDNQLNQLIVNNGNNANFIIFDATINPNLSCIQIDNSFVPTSPIWDKDATASYSTNCHFNETYVPDNNFEAYLETHDANGNVVAVGSATSMGNGIANDDYVTTSSINTVTSLIINNKNISDVTGIEDFIALTNLDCEYNQLTTVDFTSNTALVTLRCNNNQIVNLDLFPNAALQNLYCNNNVITNIQILPGSLVNLYCENNQISLLDLSNFFNLVNVHCYNNTITSLDLLNSAGNLIDFRCNNNQLSSIDIDANINLITFYCGNNQLTNLVLTTNTALEDFQCDNNQLTSLDVHLNTTLRVLLCNNNSIPNIDIAQNTALTDFYCNNNQLTSLDLSQNTALIDLRCQNNQLTDLVSPSAFLQFLNCNDNALTNLDLTQNSALIDLQCSGNQLTDIDVSANAQLVAFNCSANSLTSLNLKNGNNSNMTNIAFDATGNANLTCIEVDNVAYSTTTWTNIDVTASFSLNCHYGQTYVPDNNFEQALINLGYDIVLDDYVTTSNINNLAVLDISSKNISDLTGIEDFVGLVDLNCSANNLTSLDVTNNTALTTLGCGANLLTTLDVQQNVALTELVVTQNQLSGLDVVQNVNLLFLACESNPFTSGLDITHNTLLQDLIVNDLNLSSLDISLNDDLQTIICNNNSITVLDFTGKQDLTEIRCQNNSITDLYLRENPLLTYVDCSNNLLTDLTIDNGNNTTIPGNSFYATNNANLTCIQVDNVAYSTTNWINIDVTAGFSTNCATFGLTNVPDNNFENYLETHDASGNVVALGSATSMGNGIANDDYVTTTKISGITDLNVSGQNISDLTGIKDFVALSNLDCSGNNLTTLDVTQNTALSILSCIDNSINSLDVTQNTALTKLSCASNPLGSLDVTQNTALTLLYCGYNSLSTLDLTQNTVLTALLCDNNSLTTLDVTQNTALQFFKCQFNNIASIDITQNSSLINLNCVSNQLTELKVNNGNNANFTNFDARINPNLTCIQVDDIIIPSTPTWQKDAVASYNTNCGTFTKIWEFGQWTNGTPTITDNAIIRDFYITAIGNIEAKTLTIDPTYSVVIFGGNYIKLQSDLINNGDLIIEPTGSFVQVDNAALSLGSGHFETVIETTVLDDKDRFTYFSSPSQTEILTVFSPWANMSRIWDFDVITQDWNLLNGTEPMSATKGFAVKPATSNTFPFNAITEFIGPFNNGVFSQPLIFNPGGIDNDNNLVGNPYPSAIDASLLLNNNIGANAFYFWTHKSILGATGYVADDYAIWNNVGGIASASGSPAPSGYIASGQGFFVEANLPGNLVFDNSIRVTNNNTDFRTSDSNTTIDSDKIWINLTTGEGYFSQLLVAFIPQGTAGFDPTYDANRIDAGAITSFYSVGQNGEHFGIESRGILDEEKTITLGINLSTQITSNFTLSIDHFENLEGATVYLRDNLLGQLHNLKLVNYQFNINDLSTFNDRFELIFDRNTLGINDSFSETNNLIITNLNEEEIGINMSNGIAINRLKVYNVLGKLISDLKPNNHQITIQTNVNQGTVLFVNALLENGQIISKKFIKL